MLDAKMEKSRFSPAEVGTLSFGHLMCRCRLLHWQVANEEKLSDPIRITALHQWHVEAGAIFEDVGQWKRPWYFPETGREYGRCCAA
jgi:sarcosine oxidase subunit alpha